MMKNNWFPQLLSSYFLKYVPERTGYSENTIKSYRDTFILLFRYYKESLNKPTSSISFESIDRNTIEDFLTWLEKNNGYSVSSCNQRLAAIHAFIKYVQMEAPEYMDLCTSILSIKTKKVPAIPMNYLSVNAIRLLLSMPDAKSSNGRRDLALLTLLYDSGARVQEVADLTLGDLRIKKPATVRLTGKGNKTRLVPIMPQTVKIVESYMNDSKNFCTIYHTNPLFSNNRGEKLTRAGIAYVLNKYIVQARIKQSDLFPDKVSPHVLRHSKAMHLLEGGVNLIYIRDFLGHASVTTTEVYARANPEVKRKAIEAASPNVLPPEKYTKKEKQDMVDWLKTII